MHRKMNLASENQSCIFRSSVLRQYFWMHSYANGFFHPRSPTLIMTPYATYMTFCWAVIFFQIPVPGPTNCADCYVRLQTCVATKGPTLYRRDCTTSGEKERRLIIIIIYGKRLQLQTKERFQDYLPTTRKLFLFCLNVER